MESIFRFIFNTKRGGRLPVAEMVKSHGKGGTPGRTTAAGRVCRRRPVDLGLYLGVSLLLGGGAPCIAAGTLPAGGSVAVGSGSIATAGTTMTVQQNTPKLGVNWQSFDIGAENKVVFKQPDASSVALNRVVGGSRSEIYGKLEANGQVFLVNPNGVLFGKNAEVTVGGLVATTKNITDTDFKAGNHRFTGTGESGEVINQGNLKAIKGGYIVLAGNTVRNQGTISAAGGNAVLAAGETISLTLDTSGQLKVKVDGTTLKALIDNQGLIAADGGQVLLTARGKEMAQTSAINLQGVARARSIGTKNGKVVIDGGSTGTVVATDAKIDVSGLHPGEKGGSVTITGKNIDLKGSTAIDARGAAGGGTVLVGGDYQGKGELAHAQTATVARTVKINADAFTGDAGKVILWSDGITNFSGEVSAQALGVWGNGGLVEVSGKERLFFDGRVSTLAQNGSTGTLLLDPYDITIATTGGDITPVTLTTNLATTNMVIETASGALGVAGNGDITINDALNYSSANSLSLLAQRHVNFNAAVQNSGTGALNIVAGWDGITGLAGGVVDMTALAGNSSSYGQNGGSVILGAGTQVTGVSVGSRAGKTTVLTKDLTLKGSTVNVNSWALLGYHGNQTMGETITGGIDVQAQGNIDLTAGIGRGVWTIYGNRIETKASYAQIGNGGLNAMNSNNTTPNSTASVSGDIDIKAANLALQGGAGEYTYAHIGNGGFQDSCPVNGNITITTTGNTTLTANGSSGTVAAVTIGNSFGGGQEKTGDIIMNIGGDLALNGGKNAASVKIGHGGYTPYTGYTPPAGWLAGTLKGDITINVGGSLSMIADGTGGSQPYYGFVQIGHGGSYDSQNMTGTIQVNVIGSMAMKGGAGNASPTFIGHANFDPDVPTTRTLSGDIHVVSGAELSMQDGTGGAYKGVGSQANIGHLTRTGRVGDGTTRANVFVQSSGIDKDLTNLVTGEQPMPGTGTLLFNQLFLANLNGQSLAGNGSAYNLSGAGGDVTVVITGHDVGIPAMTFPNAGKGNAITIAATNGHNISQTGGITNQDSGNVTLIADQLYKNTSNNLAPIIVSGAGRWKIFSDNPVNNTNDIGTLSPVDFRRYGLGFSINNTLGTYTFAPVAGAATVVPATGNGMLYRGQPVWSPDNSTATLYGVDPMGALTTPSLTSGKVRISTTDITSLLAAYGLTDPTPAITSQLVAPLNAYNHVDAGTHNNAFNFLVNSGSSAAQQGMLLSSNAGTLIVTPAPLTVTANNQTRIYDNTAYAGGNGVVSAGYAAGETAAVLGGVLTYGGSSQGARSAGSYAITPGGYASSNYNISFINGLLTITPKDLFFDLQGQGNKVYDGTTAINLNGTAPIVSGVIPGDAVTIATGNVTGHVDKNVGTNKAVTYTGFALAGGDAGNYTLGSGTSAFSTATITPASLTLTATTNSKAYDGTTSALALPTYSGLQLGDTITGLMEAYADKNAGTGKTLTVTGYSLNDGNGGNNYTVHRIHTSTGVITKANITAVTGITADNKVYDGTTDATLRTDGARFIGMFAGDTLRVATATGAFDTALVGTGKRVGIAGITLNGADGANYNLLDSTATTFADIISLGTGPIWSSPAMAGAALAAVLVADTPTALWMGNDDSRIDVTQSPESMLLEKTAKGLSTTKIKIINGGIRLP